MAPLTAITTAPLLLTACGDKPYKVRTYNEQGAIWLIEDGTYAKILKKWRTTGSAIAKSEISPPELKN